MTVNEIVLHGVIHQLDTNLREMRRRAQKAEGALEKCSRDRDKYGAQRNEFRARWKRAEEKVFANSFRAAGHRAVSRFAELEDISSFVGRR
jgi:hypothetical protein